MEQLSRLLNCIKKLTVLRYLRALKDKDVITLSSKLNKETAHKKYILQWWAGKYNAEH